MAEHQGPRPLNRRELLAGAGTGILAIYLVGCGGSSSKLPDHQRPAPAPATTGGATTARATASASAFPGPARRGRHAGRQADRRVAGGGQLERPGDRLHGHQLGLDLRPHVRAARTPTAQNNDPQPNARRRPAARSRRTALVYTIPLREGVDVPQRPRPSSPSDYKYAWDARARPEANESWAASYIYTIKGAKELLREKAQKRHAASRSSTRTRSRSR